MRRVLLAGWLVSAIPYGAAFLLVTGLAFLFGKIPSRGNKLLLLPWLEFLCACLTVVISVGLLHLVPLRESARMVIACVGWMVFYANRRQGAGAFWRAVAGLLVGCGLCFAS